MRAHSYLIGGVKPVIQKLLNLQARDLELAASVRRLEAVPFDIKAINSDIAKVNAAYAAKKRDFQELEKKRSDMRIERRALEAKAAKYKAQMVEARGSAYDALNSEIEKMLSEAGKIEEAELEVLFDIDVKRGELDASEASSEAETVSLKNKIAEIEASVFDLEVQRDSAISVRELAAKEVGEPVRFTAYENLKKAGKKFPIVVKISGGECGGCYLKISGDTLERVETEDSPVYCEHCGRMLYIP